MTGLRDAFDAWRSRHKQGDAQQRIQIVIKTDGFTLLRDGIEDELWHWDHQEEIIAGKECSAMTDSVWVGLLIPGDNDYLYLDDSILGFDEFMSALETHLPDFDTEWREKVARPASALDHTIVYPKQENRT